MLQSTASTRVPGSPALRRQRSGDVLAAFHPAVEEESGSPRLALIALAVVTLGLALEANFGQFAPSAIVWMTVSLAACAAALLPLFRRPLNWPVAECAVAVGLVAQVAALLVNVPCATWPADASAALLLFRIDLAATALLAAGAVFGAPRLRKGLVPCMLAGFFLTGLWTLTIVPQPAVDVCMFQRESAEALLNGQNPYAITFRDLYGAEAGFYGATVVANGRTTFGYPYPPLPLLMSLPFHALGDFRLAQLLAVTLAAALIAYTRPTRMAAGAAALLLFTPRGFFVLEAGWIEPFVVLMLAAVVFVACRWEPDAKPVRRRLQWGALCVTLGLLFAVKQYMVLAAPLLWLLPQMRPHGQGLKVLLAAFTVAAAVTAPLALWDLQAFLHSAVTLQFHQPFRSDALSYLVPLATQFGGTPPSWAAFALAGLAMIVAHRRLPLTPSGFAAAAGVVFFLFFAFNKQAFCNYYYFVIGAFCCALAAADLAERIAPQPSPLAAAHPPAQAA